MTSQYHTKEENDLINGMDDLLSGKEEQHTIANYWANSVSQSVINHYKSGNVRDV